tara:strand:+ start:52 stop:1125 length:1074 start_codon:yes stop_codon:yes gene_type:complete
MKVSILGIGLTSLSLAKLLSNLGIEVDIFFNNKTLNINKTQTLGISKSNIHFFNDYIINIEKLLWDINQIEIYTDNLKDKRIINFEDKGKKLFSIIKNVDLYYLLLSNIKKDNFISFKKNVNYEILLKKNYDLIFNCDNYNYFSKKFFFKKIKKNYNSLAYITTFRHKKMLKNHIARQIFTKKGPLAFLPVSPTETSVVYSVKGKEEIDLARYIKKYNTKYQIIKINKSLNFELKSSNLRTYYHKNIIAFGDVLHKIHPLAGQGFNMTIRDIREIYKLVLFKKEHGLSLDTSVCVDFEKNTKNKNFIFSNSIDFIYEFFNFENKINNSAISRSVKLLGKSKTIKNFFKNFADNGIQI